MIDVAIKNILFTFVILPCLLVCVIYVGTPANNSKKILQVFDKIKFRFFS